MKKDKHEVFEIMKHLVIILCSIVLINEGISGQRIGLYSGNSYNKIKISDSNDRASINSTPSWGMRAGISFDNVSSNKKFRLKGTIGIENLEGEMYYSAYYLPAHFITDVKVKKWLASCAIYPVNFSFYKRFEVNMGIEYSLMLNEKFSGRMEGHFGPDSWDFDIRDRYDQYGSTSTIGLRGIIAYNFTIFRTLNICPEYSYYIGLSSDFRHFNAKNKSMKNFFGVSLKKQLIRS